MLAMTLVACGGGDKTSGSKAPAGSDSAKPQESSQPKPSSSRTPTPSLTMSSTDVVAKEGKVYLQMAGVARNFQQENFKWALSLKHLGSEGLDEKDNYIIGGETFADADFKTEVTIDEKGAFTFEYNLSEIQGMEAGIYVLNAGPKGYIQDGGTVTSGKNAKDGNYRYYFRHDEQVNDVNALVVEPLPPISLEEASIVKLDTIMYAKIGGTLKEGITQETLDAYDSFVQFQQVGGRWTSTRRTKADGQYFYDIEGGKAYLYADINFFAAGTNYNTHLNVTENKQADAKMDVAIDEHYYYKNGNGVLLDINVYANPNAASDDQSEFWGNLGFKVTEAPAGTEEGPITQGM